MGQLHASSFKNIMHIASEQTEGNEAYPPRITSVEHCGGCSVLQRLFSIVEAVQYCGGCSVLWGIASVHVGDSISTTEAVQYCGGIASVLWGIASVLQRNSISTAEE